MFVFCQNPIRITEKDELKHLENPFYLVPCGKCILCRLKARREWTLRLRLEASLHAENCFVTLTYDEDNVPPEVQVRDVQLFLKRFRKNSNLKFRFYSVAEYGSKTERPHFHLIFFGVKLNDALKYVPMSWDYGFNTISVLTDKRCSYACGYTQKKYDNRMDKSMFQLFPNLSYNERLALYLNCGELLEQQYHMNITPRRAEFATCSLGIGKGFLEKNWKDITEKFYINFGGKNFAIPRYFRKKIVEKDPDWNEKWKSYMEDFAKDRLVNFFDKVSDKFLAEDISSFEFDIDPCLKIGVDFDQFLGVEWQKYVDFMAKTTERKRELLKKSKKSYKEC